MWKRIKVVREKFLFSEEYFEYNYGIFLRRYRPKNGLSPYIVIGIRYGGQFRGLKINL